MSHDPSPDRFERIPLGPGRRLHVLRTPAFKTVVLKAVVGEDLSERAAATALLPMVHRRGTESLPSLQDVHRHLDDLYGASFHADVTKMGERLMPVFQVEFLSPAYADRGAAVVDDAVSFLAEALYRPRRGPGGYDEAAVEGEKNNLVSCIRSLEADHDHYAAQRCLEIMCRGERFARFEYGTEAEARALDAASLYRYFETLRDRHPLDVYAVGLLEPERLADALRAALPGRTGPAARLSDTVVRVEPRPAREASEQRPIEQAKLAAGFRTDTAYGDELLPALLFYNGILGGFAFSRLFKIVREKEGLAYYVGSHLERSKGLLLVSTGMEDGSSGRVLDLVRAIVDGMARDRVTEDEMASARARLLSRYRAVADSPHALMSLHMEGTVNRCPRSRASLLAAIGSVTREQVLEVARRVRLDTAFLLRPAAAGPRTKEAP